jgi:hypothetical protein
VVKHLARGGRDEPVKEMIALAKASTKKGDPIFYASGGNGTNGHMATALFLSLAQIRMPHVPYRSGSIGVIDLIADRDPAENHHLAAQGNHRRSSRCETQGTAQRKRPQCGRKRFERVCRVNHGRYCEMEKSSESHSNSPAVTSPDQNAAIRFS